MVGLTLAVSSGLFALKLGLDRARGWSARRHIAELIADDPVAGFATSASGEVIFRNSAAEAQFGADSASMLQALSRVMLDPGGLLLEMQKDARAKGAALHDLVLAQRCLRVRVHQIDAERFLWRIEELPLGAALVPGETAPAPPPGSRQGDELESIPVPLLCFGRDGVLWSANRMARDLILQNEEQATVFHELFDGLGRPVSDWLSDVISGRLP
ncbi:MAG: hypothetical protein JNN02_07785, partial [Tabrizicola sp.]|nr:hypothetical protein [Tabrizicola sp.]